MEHGPNREISIDAFVVTIEHEQQNRNQQPKQMRIEKKRRNPPENSFRVFYFWAECGPGIVNKA